MISYESIDKSEGVNLNKDKKDFKECMNCRYFYFSGGFKYQTFVCNACHDLT